MAIARLARPGATLSALHGWSKLPMPESEQLSELLTGEAVGALIDVDRPIDAVVTVVGSGMHMKPPMIAISAALKDPDKARSSLGNRYKLTPRDNGVTLIEGLGRRSKAGDDDDADGSPDADGGDAGSRACELAPSFGDAPVRLVCAQNAKALAELGPWLTRTATRASSTSDVHLELRLAPLKTTIAMGKGLLGAMLGGALSGHARSNAIRDLAVAAAGDLADFASDLDGLTFDATLGDAAGTLSATLHLSGKTSLLGRLAAAHPERSGPPPAVFWQLPADSDSAFFDRGTDEAAIEHARQLVLDALGEALVSDGAKPADVQPVQAALGKLPTAAPSVFASGFDDAAVRAAVAAERSLGADAKPAARLDAKQATMRALFGWRIVEVDAPSDGLASALKELATALGRPSLIKALHGKESTSTPLSLRTAPMPKGASLPTGSLHWIVELPEPLPPKDRPAKGPPPPAPRPLQAHLLLVPDGGRTWIGFGADDAALAAKLAATMASGASSGLSSRSDLEALKTASIGAGGFFTPRAAAHAVVHVRALGGGGSTGAQETLDDLDKMPNKGASPVPYSLTAQAQTDSGASVVASVTVPRAVLEDIVATLVRHGGI